MKPNPIAVVIPVYNERATLGACVRSALDGVGSSNVRLIVVDDGSTDGAVAALPRDPRLQILRHSERKGVAAALNLGFFAAKGCDIIRLHADVVVESSDWIHRLTKVAYTCPKVGIVGGRILYPDGRIESEGRSFVTGLGFHSATYARRAFQSEHAAGKAVEVDGVSGCLAYYRREAIDRVGGLDGNYGPAWMEDDDFCVAVRVSGYKVWVEPHVRAVHYARASAPTMALANPHSATVVTPLVQTFKFTARKLQSEYWQAKWGWNPHLPDVGEIRRLYGSTELCWQIGEPLRYRPNSAQPSVDCCLATWNSLTLLKRTLESIAATAYPMDRLRVIVVDNGSTDGTRALLEEFGSTAPFKLTAIYLEANVGAPAALNIAFQKGTAELVARLDDDILLPPEWLTALTSDLAARPFAGCAGLKTLQDDDRRSIQWAMERKYPENFSHDDEADGGQVDYLGRAVHVAGCCCLYRRDVFARCGLLDVRYSPTQWDDVDHGVALTHAGYEVLCDGRLAVVHKKSSNVDRSFAGMASAAANFRKLQGKWGENVFEVLDTALTASREGRCLPDDGDTTVWQQRGPRRQEFPRKAAPLDGNKGELVSAIYLNSHAPVESGSGLERLAAESLEFAQDRRRDGQPRVAVDLTLTVINFAPKHLPAYRLLAELLFDAGQAAMAQLAARRGLHLSPGDPELTRLASRDAGQVAVVERQARAALFTDSNHSLSVRRHPAQLRVLLVGPYRDRAGASDSAYVEQLRLQLEATGVDAHLRRSARPDPREFDVVHLFGGFHPHDTLTQATAIRVHAPDVPLLFSPLHADEKDAAWCGKALANILVKPAPQRDAELGLYAAGKYGLPGEVRPERGKIRISSPDLILQASTLDLADGVVVFSEGEEAALRAQFPGIPPCEIVAVADAVARFDQASPADFFSKFGQREFVLMTGRVEPASNQLMVVMALQGTNVPVVVVGPSIDSAYAKVCRRMAPAGSLFLTELPDALLISAQKAARVTAQPAFNDPLGTTALAGALAGSSLALSDRIGDRLVYAGNAHLFNPENPTSARQALVAAWNSHPAQAAKRQAFAKSLGKRDWGTAALQMKALYERTIARKAPNVAAA